MLGRYALHKLVQPALVDEIFREEISYILVSSQPTEQIPMLGFLWAFHFAVAMASCTELWFSLSFNVVSFQHLRLNATWKYFVVVLQIVGQTFEVLWVQHQSTSHAPLHPTSMAGASFKSWYHLRWLQSRSADIIVDFSWATSSAFMEKAAEMVIFSCQPVPYLNTCVCYCIWETCVPTFHFWCMSWKDSYPLEEVASTVLLVYFQIT